MEDWVSNLNWRVSFYHWIMVVKNAWKNPCNFRSFFALLPPPPPPTPSPKNQKKKWNFEKMIKIVGDIIILHVCTKNHNHMIYGSWDTEWGRQKFLSFWAIFCTFTTLTTWKIKTFKKWKHHLEILSAYTCAP